ncbi:MAG TPA: hypothetical protein VE153_28590 [Myxococcus sp.]|nr:hypothetical protein [Myxococcus sp.]
MSAIPRAVLSEHFQERMKGRRLVCAVFLTFRFDPAFFEQEVLPVFLDVPLSHAVNIKLVQLEDALRTLPGSIAVYYDAHGLVPEGGPAKLDIQRIPVRHRTGIFHPKNVFALVEDIEPDEDGHRARALLAACLSANLTRAGWWENVEVCHVEELEEGAASRLRDDVEGFLARLAERLPLRNSDDHAALRQIRAFVRSTTQRAQRSTEGYLHTHFFDGRGSVPDFLQAVAGDGLRGMNLEIISPYFDPGDESRPLAELLARFEPREVRLYLPRRDDGEALCSSGLHDWVREQGVAWSHFDGELLQRGKAADLRPRTVHAKVYRFFSAQPRREVLFVGSANLTTAAHENGGNVETGYLVEVDPGRRPEWWLEPDERQPRSFGPRSEDEGTAASGGSRLSLRYSWSTGRAQAFWDDARPSPRLGVGSQGVTLFELKALAPREWTPIPGEALERVLRSTSLLTVTGEGPEPVLLLVQEEDMFQRPSLLHELSPAEILQYWALLTPEQRTAFLEAHAPEVAATVEGAELVSRVVREVGQDTLFDRFAGIFHGFGCLERSVREALRDGKEREATYRLFGQKYDSLGNLLGRLLAQAERGEGDLIDQYVTVLCARQLVLGIQREFRDWWDIRAVEGKRLLAQLDTAGRLRERLVARDPERMGPFLKWFDPWFLTRATPEKVKQP